MLPLEIRQDTTPYNFQSVRGVPVLGIGSDGRLPLAGTINESGTYNMVTTNQFQNFVPFGATVGRVQADWLAVSNSPILKAGTTPFSQQVATEMKLPLGRFDPNNSASPIVIVQRKALVGAPFMNQQVSFLFGATIPVPETDEEGKLLSGIPKESYWLPEPYTTNNHAGAAYYWSPNARQVFAIQSGPITVTWRKTVPYTDASALPAYTNFVTASFQTNGGSIYLLYSVRYTISGSPVKAPRKIYWTQNEFRSLGKPIAVPTARVGAVAIVYNNSFPRTVAQEYVGPGHTSITDGSTNQTLAELRTLWYDQTQGNIFAYNIEGRAFLELLGDVRTDGQTREFLGFEIVDVYKQPTPLDVTIELGERLLPPSPGSLTNLFPEPVLQVGGPSFAYQRNVIGSERIELYATHATANQNDYLIHWMEEGLVGLKWPSKLARYQLIWPAEVAKYSLYVRSAAMTDTEARKTAVALSTDNVPTIEYQDPLDRVCAKLTEDFKFYTWLDGSHPAHRTLLRFNSKDQVAFERVYSFLDLGLKSPATLASSVVTNLTAWNATNSTFVWPVGSDLAIPRVVSQTINVGERIAAPEGEAGVGSNYLAGYINVEVGNFYNVGAYTDPLKNGFDTANQGAIIPVNAAPNNNQLEVWWFRLNTSSAGPNAGNTALGFKRIYWPSVIGRYTIQWPANSGEIVLASKLGSGMLDSFQARGGVYYQNDPALPGYNPNEEHAIMNGGVAYATRDDLNITNGTRFSSLPFVLLDYQAQDGRPAMAVFKVLREKPAAGYVFDYVVPAGQILQPPPPLTFLGKPVQGSGDSAINYTSEPTSSGGDLPGNWNEDRDTGGALRHYKKFTYRDRHQDYWVYRGLHAGLPPLQAGTFVASNSTFVALSNFTAVADRSFSLAVHVSRQDEYLMLLCSTNKPSWLGIQGLTLMGTPTASDLGTNTFQVVVEDLYDHTRVTNSLTLQVVAEGSANTQAPLLISCTNVTTGTVITYSNRPPFLALSPNSSNSFTMRYYYKTEASFAWPGVVEPPAVGSIVPYLRAWDNAHSQFAGGDGASVSTVPLDIVYRPVWPVRDPKDSSKPVPTVPFGYTLMQPALGLPGVRDMKTALVLYQQSMALDITNGLASVVLHDPTREKYSDLKTNGLDQLPAGVNASYYQGNYFFLNLPPHLASRLFFNPNRGTKGSLVLKGEFKNELVGDKYLLLNVLRGSDLAAAKALCPTNDNDSAKWEALVSALTTQVETFYENPLTPGAYIPNPALTVPVDVQGLAEITNDNIAVDSYALSFTGPGSGYVTLLESSGTAFTKPGDPVQMHIFKVGGSLYPGELKIMTAANPLSEQISFQHSADLGGRSEEYLYEWKIAAPVDGAPPVSDATMSRYLSLVTGPNVPRYTLGGAGIQALSDNYLVMRYTPLSATHPLYNQWSDWTTPTLAEGWIKRVLAGINPFNQRTSDLFNNRANTDASILTQAGHRWEGDIALNADTLNNYGLIEIYETILRRGRQLSIESGYNYGPANDALLLAAGYLNDLYMMEGNEAWADAANPTIGFGTKDKTYGDVATTLFAFKGQVPTVLEEELTLLRGRDDFMQPGARVAPIYNRLFWNYTRGIDAGEVIYALNYNIQEDPNRTPDGIINAADAAVMYPQGHGDAYGHYLTAIKGYYSLLINSSFDWVPRTEAVNVLGKPVQVDYQDERKFAAAAAALARAGRQVFDLTWRRDYTPVYSQGWASFGATKTNATSHITRNWGLDHWATRASQAGYLNWVVGNAILPDTDTNPGHEGIQKIDRTTVPELQELASIADGLQTALDNAEGGLSPLGVPPDAIALDLDPTVVVGTSNGTHFEQIYQRAKVALNNAVASFDDAKDVTSLMRTEQDSLNDYQAGVNRQYQAYTNALIELYGTPYTDDVGPGKLYKQGYQGPDIVHYTYVDVPEYRVPAFYDYTGPNTFKIDIQALPLDWVENLYTICNFTVNAGTPGYTNGTNYIEFNISPSGWTEKPKSWTGKRVSPGKIQQAISQYIAAYSRVGEALNDSDGAKGDLDRTINLFNAKVATHNQIVAYQASILGLQQTVASAKFANDLLSKANDIVKQALKDKLDVAVESLPKSIIAGTACGGDLLFGARAGLLTAKTTAADILDVIHYIADFSTAALEFSSDTTVRWLEFGGIAPLEWNQEIRQDVNEIGDKLYIISTSFATINTRLRELDDAQRSLQTLIAEGDRIQAEQETFSKRVAAVIQGYRTRDAAFRIFRNEKLERYKTLFDLASRYALLAANAYDYETGLLNTSAGRQYINRIVSSRALGVVHNGEPQYAGSDTGDPGLSSALAEIKADWDVLRGRLGFNNPDAYGTTCSLRTECFRILPDTNGLSNWKDLLQRARVNNILEDSDVRRNCMQIDPGDGLPAPGIILTFSTTIADGYNLFGLPIMAGDHAFSSSSFATKIFAVGVAMEGYRGMDNPSANGSAVTGAGGTSPSDPSFPYLDPLALSATPYIYLIPVGVDSMRSPPLGDMSKIRTWTINDVAIPMPFNIGASDFSTKQLWQSSDSLTEPLFAIRKHQAFRPVSSATFFSSNLYTSSGGLQRSQYTNNRLVGRSVWNSQWKLVIPGKSLLSDSHQGLDRFIQTVSDLKLHFVSYSYSGN
jgi:hypothetical protein